MSGQGVVQSYDPATGAGVVVRDDIDGVVYLRPGSLKGSIFRNLRQGQRIIFEIVEDGDDHYATNIRVGQDLY